MEHLTKDLQPQRAKGQPTALWTLIKARLRIALNTAFKRGKTRLMGTFVKALAAGAYLALFALFLRGSFAKYPHPRLAATAAFAAAALLMAARAVQYALAQTPGKGSMRILKPLPVSSAKICAARIVDGAFDNGTFTFLSAGPIALGYALAFPPNPFQALVFCWAGRRFGSPAPALEPRRLSCMSVLKQRSAAVSAGRWQAPSCLSASSRSFIFSSSPLSARKPTRLTFSFARNRCSDGRRPYGSPTRSSIRCRYWKRRDALRWRRP